MDQFSATEVANDDLCFRLNVAGDNSKVCGKCTLCQRLYTLPLYLCVYICVHVCTCVHVYVCIVCIHYLLVWLLMVVDIARVIITIR